MSVTVVYAWHGIVYNARNASNQTFSDDKGMPGDGNLHHWMSFVFKVFHESAAEGIDNINQGVGCSSFNGSFRNSLKYFHFIGIDGDGSWGLLSVFFLILFLSGILTQSTILYHITQTTHDLVLNSRLFKSSHIAFWRLAVGICLTIGLLALINFMSVSIEQYYEGYQIFN